jgi:hypothetical protein
VYLLEDFQMNFSLFSNFSLIGWRILSDCFITEAGCGKLSRNLRQLSSENETFERLSEGGTMKLNVGPSCPRWDIPVTQKQKLECGHGQFVMQRALAWT